MLVDSDLSHSSWSEELNRCAVEKRPTFSRSRFISQWLLMLVVSIFPDFQRHAIRLVAVHRVQPHDGVE